MKKHIFLIAIVFLITAIVFAAPEASKPKANAGKEQVISAQLSGPDSLDVLDNSETATSPSDAKRSHLENTVFRREKPIEYASGGRRDPFRALIVDEKKEGEIETELLQLDGAVLSGVVWSDGQYLALVRDKDGKNYFLRDGDPVFQGHVSIVTQSTASFEISDFGDYQKVTLKVRAKDSKDKGKGQS